jgi:hypothetical protein
LNTFWDWFLENEDRLFTFESSQEALFDELAVHLRKIDEDLTFEFGPVVDGRRDLVVSAGGHRRGFPAVDRLCDAAPNMARWNVIRFRPQRSPVSIVELGGKTLDPRQVDVVLLHNRKQVGLHVFVPGYEEGDSTLGQMVYLMLDEALGEYVVETQVALIKLYPYEQASEGERVPMSDMAPYFDDLVGRLRQGA